MAPSLLVFISVALSVFAGVCASKDASEGFGTVLNWKSPAMLKVRSWRRKYDLRTLLVSQEAFDKI